MKYYYTIVIAILFFMLLSFEFYINNTQLYEPMENKITKKNPNKFSSIAGLDTDFHAEQPRDTSNDKIVKSIDTNGKPIDVTISKTLGNPLYYQPGQYYYGGEAYVPTYEDAIYLANIQYTGDGSQLEYKQILNKTIDTSKTPYDFMIDDVFHPGNMKQIGSRVDNKTVLRNGNELSKIIEKDNQDFLDNQELKAISMSQGAFQNEPAIDNTLIDIYPGNYDSNSNILLTKPPINTTPPNTTPPNTTPPTIPKMYKNEFLNDNAYALY